MERGHSTVRAIVREIDAADAMIEVEGGGCGRCHEVGGCGGNNLTQMFCAGAKTYRVANPVGASIDERVIVDISPGSVKKSANLAYGVPLVLTISFALLGTGFSGDSGGMLGAFVGFAIGMLALRHLTKPGTGNHGGRPYIVSRISHVGGNS